MLAYIPTWILPDLERKPDPEQRLYLPMPPLPPRLEDDGLEQEGTHVVVIDLNDCDDGE